ncbi:thiamine phosphate synthase [Bryobacter aggregatus]|uniref:thiamine phosphate synthase n=1 Tax=Bryobacter aggregatus TaxID=360054 RepID=UPI00068E99D1|nr:thiamine phosphate synthase [Bryobacter aggregatus]
MTRHCITEGLGPVPSGASVVQLRAKGLSDREVLRRALLLRASFAGTLLINERFDLCLVAGADGVHLPSNRIAPYRLTKRYGLLVGVSCHSIEDVKRAEGEGADYVYLSPIFESLSKPGYGPALGLEVLAEAVRAVRIPVIALGGVNAQNEAACRQSGAAGIAGISYFGNDMPGSTKA